MAQAGSLVHFSGQQYLRHRLVLSILSGKPVRIDKIRSDDKNPGLKGGLHRHPVEDILTCPNRF
jgi:RNA 3'-terminal phosphate cyclase-like protein